MCGSRGNGVNGIETLEKKKLSLRIPLPGSAFNTFKHYMYKNVMYTSISYDIFKINFIR